MNSGLRIQCYCLSSNTWNSVFQDTIQLLITIMLLADLSITLLTLLEFYWISLGAFLAVLLVLPLSLLSPFPAGLNALFSKEPRRSSLTRIYALWNATSLSNIVSYTIIASVLFTITTFFIPWLKYFDQFLILTGLKKSYLFISDILCDYICPLQVVAFISGICHYGFWFAQPSEKANTWFIRR